MTSYILKLPLAHDIWQICLESEVLVVVLIIVTFLGDEELLKAVLYTRVAVLVNDTLA